MPVKFLLMISCCIACTVLKAQRGIDTTDSIADTVQIASQNFAIGSIPKPLEVRTNEGIVTFPWVQASIIHKARTRKGGLYETRATVTPSGDYLLMFPDGGHYGQSVSKTNDMLAYRSKDKGKTWTGPTIAFDIDYNQHGFIPFIPSGSKRMYAFGTQPMWTMYNAVENRENAPIGYRYSDDDGLHWSEVRFIRPKNDSGFKGMSVMRMTETDKGTWLLGTHEADWTYKPLLTRQYILRSDDQGKSWTLLPGKRHAGWFVKGFDRMDEGRPINIGNDKVLLMLRTPEGHLWSSTSVDDGKTWADPAPTTLIHPDAPPMLFKLSDNKTLIAFHHNRHHDSNYSGLSGAKREIMKDRSELWFSLSTDDGKTWSEPRLFLVNALSEGFESPFRNYQCSYMDMFADNGELHCFIPHRWQRALYVHFKESDLSKFPTQKRITGKEKINLKQNILISVDDFSQQQLEMISKSVQDWANVKSIPQSSDENYYRQELNDSDICVGWPSANWIEESGINFLQIGSSGWDAYQNKGLENIGGFTFCTAKGIYTIGLVEHAIAMMFALVRRIPTHIRDKDQHQFKRHLPYATEITGSTACIVGMGDAGILLAKRLKGLEMKITAVVRRKDLQFDSVDEIILSENLERAVANADHIFLLAPGLPENESLFNERIFNACRPSTFFYNLSRGTNVNEDSLYQALKDGKIAGVGLDVTRIEPLPPGDRLWELGDNVLITGHSAGLSSGHTGRFCELVIRNLYSYHHNLPLENRVI